MTLEEQISLYTNVVSEYLKILKEHQKVLDELKKQADYCPECKRYFDKSEGGTASYEKELVETVYRDCGYGDDDELADVTRRYTYRTCPYCGGWCSELSNEKVSEKNRGTRWERSNMRKR